MGGEGGFRILDLMISHDQNEWWSGLEGPNGLLLLLVSRTHIAALILFSFGVNYLLILIDINTDIIQL